MPSARFHTVRHVGELEVDSVPPWVFACFEGDNHFRSIDPDDSAGSGSRQVWKSLHQVGDLVEVGKWAGLRLQWHDDF
ncbi:hypothetical protein MetexDRAFT_2180 [Methylorubrum extorquens DSM 13060]|uniref:Uncharacterized protein n=1 Tax=Methylorubrum extorquens DSM 13060 TaxID=882800 RepID=H1KHR8_METEX|nr:hypothetical protein MetexDRAFT_2180 [Methylorubrum extorquens DSM 13060]